MICAPTDAHREFNENVFIFFHGINSANVIFYGTKKKSLTIKAHRRDSTISKLMASLSESNSNRRRRK